MYNSRPSNQLGFGGGNSRARRIAVKAKIGAIVVAEFVGTFALTFIGILAIHQASQMRMNAGLLAIAVAHGLTLAIMVTAAMPASGGHINPAVTFGFLVTGKINLGTALIYILSQLAGSIVAALAAHALYPTDAFHVVYEGTPGLGAGVPVAAALLAEIIATFFLVWAVWGTAVDPRAPKVGGFAIGLTIAFDILAIGPISGGSMNPARSFGPTLIAATVEGVTKVWDTNWIYWVGPFVGAALAALIYKIAVYPRDNG
jgi:MIP family channel proteins